MITIERIVAAPSDDAIRSTVTADYWDETAPAIQAGYSSGPMRNMGSAMRFLDIPVISWNLIRARVIFTASLDRPHQTVNTRFRCQAADAPLEFTTSADFDARDWTAARVDWDDIPAWLIGQEYESPDITPCVQEVLARPGWTAGNPLVVLWDDFEQRSTQSSARVRTAYGAGSAAPELAPRLLLTYISPSVLQPNVFTCSNTATSELPRLLYTTSFKLRHAVFYAHTNDQLLGNYYEQSLPLNAGETISLENIDIGKVWVRNAVPADNGTVVVVGTRGW